jgi:hypothetical protein
LIKYYNIHKNKGNKKTGKEMKRRHGKNILKIIFTVGYESRSCIPRGTGRLPQCVGITLLMDKQDVQGVEVEEIE